VTVFVRYLVPVLAEVDVAAGRVIRVQVDDEAVGDAEQVFVVDGTDLADAEQEAAISVAEDSFWPAWEFGSG
jgi:hypothetical protein